MHTVAADYYIVVLSAIRAAASASMMQKRVLMVAFHFPPMRGSSGIQRTLRFARYLPEFGWEPQILTVHSRIYDAVDGSEKLPPELVVHRVPAFDAARHFAIGKRYPSFLARPDRWASWWWSAVPAGLAAIRAFRPHALWSTYPIATAHAIGHTLARITRLPWIADFRDPMAQDGYPTDPAQWQAFSKIESRTIGRAVRSIFTTPGAADEYRARYPAYAKRIDVIENGYDEEMFRGLPEANAKRKGRPIVLLHSGIVYPLDRDPSALFQALQTLRASGDISPDELRIVFRAPVHEDRLLELADRFRVRDFIAIGAYLPYREALEEMIDADALLVMQAATCNQQIPAKLYEYLRAGRPIIGLADPAGDTGAALRSAGLIHIAALEDPQAIAMLLRDFVADLLAGRAPVPSIGHVRLGSRRARTSELASVLDDAIPATPAAQ